MIPARPYHPLIYKYLQRYQEDPSSRVFALLAEAYRKAGLLQEAVEVAREGLLIHPTFVGGRVALARALFDLTLYAQVIQELKEASREVPDNLAVQRLIAESCLMLGRTTEALEAYKVLLFYQPKDEESAKLVYELEVEAYESGKLLLRTDTLGDTLTNTPTGTSADSSVALPALPPPPEPAKVRRMAFLQALLPRVERYRLLTRS